MARCRVIIFIFFLESYLVMMIRRNLLSNYAPPLTFFSLKMWHFFQQKSFVHFALFFFLCCHNAKNSTQKHLNFANEDIYRFILILIFRKKKFIFIFFKETQIQLNCYDTKPICFI